MRITDQYFWNVIFVLFFLGLIIPAAIILETESYKPIQEFTLFDIALVSLATFRFIRLFVYDNITKFFREQFWDAVVSRGGKVTLVKPKNGPRRTIADLLSCPWCFGVWAGAVVVFFYALWPFAYYFVLFLAIAAIASFFQILTNMIGWKAEQLKKDVER